VPIAIVESQSGNLRMRVISYVVMKMLGTLRQRHVFMTVSA